MARLKELLKEAREMGLEHGNNAASWYFDRSDPSREDYLKVLKGIEDGDPEILDTFNSSPLSGEIADDMTPQRLWEAIGANQAQQEVAGDELCEAYEEGYSQAYEATIVSECEYQLQRNVVFHVEVGIIRQDEQKLLSDIEDLLAKANCDLLDSNVSEEGEVIA